jgi:hypothetical protein
MAEDKAGDKEKVDKALERAVSALYFRDNADYGSYLWEIVEVLDPELCDLLEEDGDAAYEQAQERVK